jgi:endonuclease YncB( thermonuclease family)
MKYILLFLPAIFLSQRFLYVQRVIDGDTFVTNGIHYRIAEIDAPEKDQTYGKESKQYLTYLIARKTVRIIPLTTDSYGRQIVKVYYYQTDIGEKMISTGNAWWYERYSNNLKYRKLQEIAKQNKIGLWKYEHINPYRFRSKTMERVLRKAY